MLRENEQLIIAGPCAAESREQVLAAAREARKRDIPIMRASLWKPRTEPGFEGVGERGISWLAEAAEVEVGVIPATEVLLPEHAEKTMKGLLAHKDSNEILLWLGSRNQNHLIQREVARAANDPRVILLIKNQPWPDERHWIGIVNHVIQGGFPSKQIILCHRGFCPNGFPNPRRLRNLPDWEMAARVREQLSLPMVIDPSHMAGESQKVREVVEEALRWEFDGFMIEVHPSLSTAHTDARQQLTWDQFDQVLNTIRVAKHTRVA